MSKAKVGLSFRDYNEAHKEQEDLIKIQQLKFRELKRENRHLKAETIKEAVKIVEEIKANYPFDIFPPNGKSLDARAAQMARVTCDNILAKLNELES